MKNKAKSNHLVDCMNAYADIVNRIISLKDKHKNNLFLTSNIVGDYAEILVARKLGLSRKKASNHYVDAVNENTQAKYQIKARWMNGKNSYSKREFGKIPSNFNDENGRTKTIEEVIDFIVLVIFEKATFDDPLAYIIETTKIEEILKEIEKGGISNKIITTVEDGRYYKIKYYEDAFNEAQNKKLIEPLMLDSI